MSSEPIGTPGPSPDPGPDRSKRPVLFYILILLAAALLLMGLSFLMHQRTNTLALGELQKSVSAMQEVQASQEKIIALQDELSNAEKELDDLQSARNDDAAKNAKTLEAQKEATLRAEQTAEALEALYTLQQQWLLQRYDDCRVILQDMADRGLVDYLPADSPRTGVTPPAVRYRQFEEALEKLLAPENEEETANS